MHAGIDSHKDTLAVAIVDDSGRKVATTTVVNEPRGYDELAKLLADHGVLRVGMECSGTYGRPGSVALNAAGFVVFEVPATMTVRERNRQPARGKSDPIDALAVARVVARGEPLPPARCESGPADDLQQLTHYRRPLVKERTRISNRVHVELTILRPGYQRDLPQLTRPVHLAAARKLLRGLTGVRVGITRARLDRLRQLDAEIKALAVQISGIDVGYGYDLDGDLTSLTYPNGRTVTRGFDDTDRLTSVTDWNTKTTNFGYDPDGDLTTTTSPNGVAEATTLNAADQVTAMSDTLGANTLASYSYSRDQLGQLTATTATGATGQGNETYDHSPLNQLTTYDAASNGAYGYDAADNLTSVPNGTTQTFDPANQLTKITTAAGQVSTLGYDSRGDRSSLTTPTGTTSYGYDQANRLTSTTSLMSRVGGGASHSVALRADGTVFAWGLNSSGQLGNNTTTTATTPISVPNLAGVTAVTAGRGGAFTVALKSDGTVWTWGLNSSGQLGNNSTTSSSVPVQVSGLTGVVAIAAGTSHALALKSDGTVWAWGLNSSGQLGNNSTTTSKVPVQVSNLTGVVAIGAGASHSLAVKSGGTVWAWGLNSSGQLGNNSTTTAKVPVQASGLTNISAVAGGASHSIALKSDGTVWTWGLNSSGQLGNNSTTTSKVPIQVSGLTGVTAVAAGASHNIALKSDGSVYGWGLNTSGQLGLGNTTSPQKIPVQITALSNIAAVGAGDNHSLAVTTTGTVKAWGANTSSQRGNGNTTTQTSPVTPTGFGGTLGSYHYDGDGLRTSKTIATGTLSYSWDNSSDVPLLLSDGSMSYVYGPGGLQIEQIDTSGTPTYIQHDQQNSTRLLTNPAGAVAGTYTYDPYGNTLSHTGTATSPLQYDGQYQDTETGLYYLRARYYDPTTAQFLTRDPIEQLTQQPYQYAIGDPLDLADPTGLFGWSSISHAAGWVAVGAGVVAVVAVTVAAAPVVIPIEASVLATTASVAGTAALAASAVETGAACYDAATGGPTSGRECAVDAATSTVSFAGGQLFDELASGGGAIASGLLDTAFRGGQAISESGEPEPLCPGPPTLIPGTQRRLGSF